MNTFQPYTPDQPCLLPPVLQAWLPEDHLAAFLREVVEAALDLTLLLAPYETGDGRGQPPYHPARRVKLLRYGYCTGKPSSRQIERATDAEIPDRVRAAKQPSDHDPLAAVRQTHWPALAARFAQGRRLCPRAGRGQLGHVALEGTQGRAHASKPKAMRDGRRPAAERQRDQAIAARLAEAQRVDAAEDAQSGRGRRGDALPAELARRESRLAKLRAAKAALEAEAQGAARARLARPAGGRRAARRRARIRRKRPPPRRPSGTSRIPSRGACRTGRRRVPSRPTTPRPRSTARSKSSAPRRARRRPTIRRSWSRGSPRRPRPVARAPRPRRRMRGTSARRP